MLHEFVAEHRHEIIAQCRKKVASRSLPPPTASEIEHGVPVFLDQLIDALRGQGSDPNIDRSAMLHGHDLLLQGFTVSQVVHDYGDVCQSITDLAVALDAPISTDDFRTLNRCLDDAIASAVTEYGHGRSQSDIAQEEVRGTERVGFLIHELRNLAHTSIMAFDFLKKGNVGIAGSTGAVLERSLTKLVDLIDRSVSEVRLAQTVTNPERILVAEFINELGTAAQLDAHAKGLTLTVVPVDKHLAVEADRQVLASAVSNLLQNAFKFTRPHTTVTLRVGGNSERVLIAVQDECGGLPSGPVDELFRPFEQRGANRTGLGLGLAFCRWAAEANHGRIYTRNVPGHGCVFTIDLPHSPEAAAAPVKPAA